MSILEAVEAMKYIDNLTRRVVYQHEKRGGIVFHKTMAKDMMRRAEKRAIALTEAEALDRLKRYYERREMRFYPAPLRWCTWLEARSAA